MTRFGRILRVSFGFSAFLCCAVDGRSPAAEPPVRQAKIDAAIARGVAFLRAEQGENGAWLYNFNNEHTLGITALAGLALLENGVKPNDPAVAKADKVVRTLARKSNQTYDLSLAILFLSRVRRSNSPDGDALFQRLGSRLASGGGDGLWGYTVPPDGSEDRTRSGSVRRRVPGAQGGDNSNTQFALIGLWAAGRHGFDSNLSLEAIDGHFRSSQDRGGHWGYSPGDAGRNSMTCAGLLGLGIASARPALAERQTARARGAALAADPIFTSALLAVGRDARQIGPQSDIYYLWSLERVCVALGLHDLDGFDWYAAGAGELLRRQQADGGWANEIWGRLPNTCLALLFLRKANLAFELDRVLRLPGAALTETGTPAIEENKQPPPVENVGNAGDASVVVTGASDAKFPEIAVDFEVKRPDGSFVLDAKRDDFKVMENGVGAAITGFQSPTTREGRPVTVVLVVDRSRSMEEENRIGGLKRAVATFLDGLPAGSRVSVVAFGSEVQRLCPFTNDFQRVRTAVDRLTPAGATRYYDAVAESLELIRHEGGRRAVLALTDGEDTFSQDADLDSVIASAVRLGVPIHTLGLGTEDEIESGALRKLAAATRGQYYPARQVDQLRSIYEEIAQRLRSGYALTYQTDRKIPDGTLRPVRVIYRAGRIAGETALFIPGMVVPAPGWSPLFLVLVVGLVLLSRLPGWWAGRSNPPVG